MRGFTIIIGLFILAAAIAANGQQGDVEFSFSPESFLDTPADKLKNEESLSLDGLAAKDVSHILARIATMPKLVTLKLYSSDLSRVDDKTAVPPAVSTVLISGGKISQRTIQWLSKFPSGTTLVIGCDATGLVFDLGKFSWITFDNCSISRSAVIKLVEKMTKVTFKEVTVVADE